MIAKILLAIVVIGIIAFFAITWKKIKKDIENEEDSY
jgi:hypothetical protein